MTYDGRLLEVEVLGRGTSATEAVAVGGVEVGVQDLTEFSDEGGRCEIDGTQYDYSGIIEATDGSMGGTLVLADPLTVAVAQYDPVLTVVGDRAASDAWAVIDLGSPRQDVPDDGSQGVDPASIDGPDMGDVVRVPLSFSQRLVYREGVYEPPVPVQVADDLTAVIDVPGVPPSVSWDAIDPTTVPPLGGGGPTEPLATSPAVEVNGTADALILVLADQIDQFTTVSYHLSTTADFTPDATTLLATTRSPIYTAVAMPDGSPLVLGTTYYVRTQATNGLSPDPAPSAPFAGTLDPSVVSDLVLSKVSAGFVLAGSIQVGNMTIDPDAGITIPQSDGGQTNFPVDGSVAQIDAHVHARSLAVDDDWSINGFGELKGDMQATSGVSNPNTAPTLNLGWPSLPVTSNFFNALAVDTDNSLLAVEHVNGLYRLMHLDGGTGATTFLADLTGAIDAGYAPVGMVVYRPGLVTDPTAIILLIQRSSDNATRLVRINRDTFAVINDKSIGTKVLPSLSLDSGERLHVVWNVGPTSGNMTARVQSYDCADATMPAVGATADIITWVYGTPGSSDYGNATASACAFASADTLYVGRVNDKSLRAWQIGVAANGVDSTFTRKTAWDIALSGGASVQQGFLAGASSTHNADTAFLWARREGDSLIYKYRTTAGATSLKVAYTWYDGDPTGGTHESLPSPVATISLPPGRWASATFPTPPEASITDPTRTDKANRLGVYAATGSGSLKRQTYLAAGIIGMPVGSIDHLALVAGAAPPATDGFVNSTAAPARWVSAALDTGNAPLIELRGNGFWRLGGLSGDATGKVTFPDTGWLPLTSTVSGVTVQYRVLAGVFYLWASGNSTISNQAVVASGGVPAAYRPAAQIGGGGVVANTTGTLSVTPAGAVWMATVDHASATGVHGILLIYPVP